MPRKKKLSLADQIRKMLREEIRATEKTLRLAVKNKAFGYAHELSIALIALRRAHENAEGLANTYELRARGVFAA